MFFRSSIDVFYYPPIYPHSSESDSSKQDIQELKMLLHRLHHTINHQQIGSENNNNNNKEDDDNEEQEKYYD